MHSFPVQWRKMYSHYILLSSEATLFERFKSYSFKLGAGSMDTVSRKVELARGFPKQSSCFRSLLHSSYGD